MKGVREIATGSGVSTREAVLNAALEVFSEYTFNGAPMTAVASAAGVAVGTIYRHFPSKEALGNAVYQRCKRQLLEYARRADDSDLPVREVFARLWRAFSDFAAEHPTAFAFAEHQQHESYLDDTSRDLFDQVVRVAEGHFKRGQASGEVRSTDAKMLCVLAYGSFVGLNKAQRAGMCDRPGADRQAEEAVWGMLAA